MGYTLPEWTQAVYPDEIEQAASYVYAYHNYDSLVKRINSGYLMKKILEDTQSKIDNYSSERKIYLYSGHESTIGYMLDALQIDAGEVVPPYGCAISFELRQLKNDYYIRVSVPRCKRTLLRSVLIVTSSSVHYLICDICR